MSVEQRARLAVAGVWILGPVVLGLLWALLS